MPVALLRWVHIARSPSHRVQRIQDPQQEATTKSATTVSVLSLVKGWFKGATQPRVDANASPHTLSIAAGASSDVYGGQTSRRATTYAVAPSAPGSVVRCDRCSLKHALSFLQLCFCFVVTQYASDSACMQVHTRAQPHAHAVGDLAPPSVRTARL